jgi:DNA (cytosine-5)-methyltransferase 1
MKYLSICSGIEAASTAWHSLGWEPLAFSEIEPFPCAVLAHHWPHVPNLGDMTKHHDWPNDIRPDLIVGGTPCQAFSVAGLREGLADPRGNLTLTFLSIVAQYRPEWVVWENVPGVLSDKTGAFGAFLGGLGELGYGFAYRVLDAQFLGVAQRRRRVFVVANLTDWRRAAAVLFEQHSLSGDSPPSRSKGKGTATGFETGPSGSDEPVFLDRAMFNQGANAQFNPVVRQDGLSDTLVARGPHAIAARMVAFGEYATDDTASTCKQRDYKDATDLVITTQYGEIAGTLNTVAPPAIATNYAVRRLTPTECERLQGFSDGHTAVPFRGKPAADGPRYKAIGNSMAVPVMHWIGKRIELINSYTAH